jgi:hypothetical protein
VDLLVAEMKKVLMLAVNDIAGAPIGLAISYVSEENSQNNNAFQKLANMVNVYLNESWRPVEKFQQHL